MIFLLVLLQMELMYSLSCPQVCTCKNSEVDCYKRKFVHVPVDIPIKTTTLFLGGNGITTIDNDDFRNLKELEFLYLYSNRIRTVEKTSFEHLLKLKEISFSYNEIEKIENGTFDDQILLETLNLGFNNIEEIEPGSLETLRKLRKLYLNNNNLWRLTTATFRNLVALERLNLKDNKIKEMEIGTFRHLINLKFLSLSNNNINNIVKGLFENLPLIKEIYLSNNTIQRIQSGVFVDLPRLEQIVLNNNRLEEIESGSFGNLPVLKGIYLDSNKIKNVDVDTLRDLPNLRVLYLNSNPLHCGCETKKLKNYANSHAITLSDTNRHGKLDPPSCTQPETLFGRTLSSLEDTSFYCECRIPGYTYRGLQNSTVSGRACQYWRHQIPHQHNYGVFSFAEDNFCRNFDIEIPWCFTKNSNVRWEPCFVPVCENTCYKFNASTMADLKKKCPMSSRIDCKQIKTFLECFESLVEKRHSILCPTSAMLKRAQIIQLAQDGISTDTLRDACYPSPCTIKEERQQTIHIFPHNQEEYCWSVTSIINTEVSKRSKLNKTTCNAGEKLKVMKSMEKELTVTWRNGLLKPSQCSLSFRDYYMYIKQIPDFTEEELQKNMYIYIGTGTAILIILILAVFMITKFVRKRKILRTNQKARPNSIRATHIYDDIDDTILCSSLADYEPPIQSKNDMTYTPIMPCNSSEAVQCASGITNGHHNKISGGSANLQGDPKQTFSKKQIKGKHKRRRNKSSTNDKAGHIANERRKNFELTTVKYPTLRTFKG